MHGSKEIPCTKFIIPNNTIQDRMSTASFKTRRKREREFVGLPKSHNQRGLNIHMWGFKCDILVYFQDSLGMGSRRDSTWRLGVVGGQLKV